MKKLIAISVVFALVAGAAFAAEVSAGAFGTVNVLQGDTGEDSVVTSSGQMNQVRIEASGEDGDGVFGGWIRVEGVNTVMVEGDLTDHSWETAPLRSFKGYGIAWWKPMDMFKLSIGGNPDGIFGKEGNASWMFYQTTSDTDVVNPGNAWGGAYGDDAVVFRSAFFGGFADERAFMTISPAEMVDINIAIPFIANAGELAANVFKQSVAQIDLKLDFGNIALTYVGGKGYKDELSKDDPQAPYDDPASIFLYYGGSFGDLSIDFGFGYHMAQHYDGSEPECAAGDKEAGDSKAQPLAVGLAVKYATDSFGVKFRTVASLAGADKATNLKADVLPFFIIDENLRAYVSVGIAMKMPEEGDSLMAWHFNPYLEVGSEWGPKFIAGIRAEAGYKPFDEATGKYGDAITKWAIPVALRVGF